MGRGLDPAPYFSPEFPPTPLTLAVTESGLQTWSGRLRYQMVWWRPWPWIAEVTPQMTSPGGGAVHRGLALAITSPVTSTCVVFTVTGGPIGMFPVSGSRLRRDIAKMRNALEKGRA